MTLLEEIMLLIEEHELGTYDTTGDTGTIYALDLPQGPPDVCMAVAFYTGPMSDSGLPYDQPRCQIKIRGSKANKLAGFDLAQRVYDRMHGLRSRYLAGGTWMVQCLAWQGIPAYLGKDGNGRDLHTVNLEFDVHTRAPRARSF